MIGRPNYIPDDWTCWPQVEPYNNGYPVVRIHEDHKMLFGTFVCESDADAFVKLKYRQQKAGKGI